MKRKTLTLTICLLALVAIVSVGFASWIITKPVEEQAAAGSITVEEVKTVDNNIIAEFRDPDSFAKVENPIIHYGSINENSKNPLTGESYKYVKGKPSWLTNDGQHESLEVTLVLTASSQPSIDYNLNLFVYDTANATTLFNVANPGETLTGEPGFFAAKNAGAIGLPQISVNGGTYKNVTENFEISSADFTAENATTVKDPEGSFTAIIKICFTWGADFGNVNPFAYLQDKEYDTSASDAIANLELIEAMGKKAAFKVKVSA